MSNKITIRLFDSKQSAVSSKTLTADLHIRKILIFAEIVGTPYPKRYRIKNRILFFKAIV